MRHLLAAAVTLAALLGASCGSGGASKLGAQPSWRESNNATTGVEPSVFAPSSPAAGSYNAEPGPHPRAPLTDAVLAAVSASARATGTPEPTPDARLSAACEELAKVVPEQGIVAYSAVEFALQRHGIIEPSPHLLVVWGDLSSPSLFVDQLKPHIPEILLGGATSRVGIGYAERGNDGGVVVFALQKSGVTTLPMPRELPDGGDFTIQATMAPEFRDPEVFVTREDGVVEHVPVRIGVGGQFAATIGCGARTGRQQVEITGTDKSGSTVLANFPVWCRTQAPTTLAIETVGEAPPATPADAERQLLTLVNRDRIAAGVPPLELDEAVADVARGHSAEMQRTGEVGHLSPLTGSAADRVAAAGIKTSAVLENVARAYGVGEAHAGLMNSPGHRANLLSPLATRIGIGVVFGSDDAGRHELFITQVFIRVPPKIDPAAAADALADKLHAVYRTQRQTQLEALAQQAAEELASGKTRDEIWPRVRQGLQTMATRYKRIGSVVTAVSDLDAVTAQELVGEYRPVDVGVGIAQGFHPDIGERAVWIVLFLGETR